MGRVIAAAGVGIVAVAPVDTSGDASRGAVDAMVDVVAVVDEDGRDATAAIAAAAA